MADIDLERKSSGGGMKWMWILLAVIILIILAWLACPDADEDMAVVPVEEAEVMEPEIGEIEVEPVAPEGIPIAVILDDPDTWIGRTAAGEVSVAEVPTDRGFWIEQDGRRLFALIVDRPEEEPKDINPGQRLELSDATVWSPMNLEDVPGRPLDDDTVRIAREQQVVLVVDERNIEFLERPTPTG